MKRVVSYSLFHHAGGVYEDPAGTDRADWRGWYYVRYLPALVRAHHACFPDWEMRVHCDETIYHRFYGDALLELEARGLVKLVHLPAPKKLCEGMLWRMMPAWDAEVDVFVTRDVDSLPTPRDRAMVDEWLASGAPFHVVNDHPSHAGIMGGTAGYRAAAFRDVTKWKSWGDMIEFSAGDLDEKGADQDLLNDLAAALVPVVVHGAKYDAAEEHRWTSLRPVADMHARPDWFPAHLAEPLNRLGGHVGKPADPEPTARYIDAASMDCSLPDAISLKMQEVRDVEYHLGIDASEAGPRVPARRSVSSATPDDTYAFFLPLTTLLWHRMRYCPTVFLVGTCAEWRAEPRFRLALDACRRSGAEVRFVDRVPGRRDSTVAQVCRLGAATLPPAAFRDGDFALTTDVDLWPLDPKFYDVDPQRLTLWYANAYAGESVPHYPLCHVGGTARTWMGLTGGTDGMRGLLGRIFDDLPKLDDEGKDGWAAWNHDEYWISRRIALYADFGNPVTRIDRPGGPPDDRIDRSRWPRGRVAEEFAQRKPVDAHVVRPGWHEDNWRELRELYCLVLPEEYGWFSEYVARYRLAMSEAGVLPP